MAIKKYQISNTGYTGQQISSIGEFALSYTGTQGRTDYYTTSDSSQSVTTNTGSRITATTFITKATMTSTTGTVYSTSSSWYESSEATSTSSWYTTSEEETVTQTGPAETDTTTTTTEAEYSTESEYTTDDWYESSSSTVTTSEKTITGTMHDYSFTTKLNRNEYVSITYNRTEGGQYYQNNNYYTDGYTYMLTNDYGGLSVTNVITTGTSGTYTRTSKLDYIAWAYVWDWWCSTTTLWNETRSTSDWSQTYVQEYTTNWSWTDWHYEGSWTTTSYSKIDYYTTTTTQYMYTDSWTTTWFSTTRSSGYQVTTQGNLEVTSYFSLTDSVNKMSKTYINNNTATNKILQMSVYGTSTLIQRLNIPFNGMSSSSTILNMGLNTVTTTSTSTTFEYY